MSNKELAVRIVSDLEALVERGNTHLQNALDEAKAFLEDVIDVEVMARVMTKAYDEENLYDE